MKNKLNHLLKRFLIRSFRIAIGIAILILVFYCAMNAREIATSSISFNSLSTTEILSFIFFSVLAYLFFFLGMACCIWQRSDQFSKGSVEGKGDKKTGSWIYEDVDAGLKAQQRFGDGQNLCRHTKIKRQYLKTR